MYWCQQKRYIAVLSALLLISIWAILSNKPTTSVSLISIDTLKQALDLTKLTGTGSADSISKRIQSCDETFSDVFSMLTSGYRHCLLENIAGKNAWDILGPSTSYCLGNALWRLLDVKELENRDDMKLAILPPSDITAPAEFAECTEVTLGIGRDIEAELLLRQLQPHCRFFGADPIRKSGSIFKELGEYFEIAVADKAGVLKASVLENGKYIQKDVKTVTLPDFLHHINVSKVDYILIDNEGPEYKLFQQLLSGGEIEANNISLCQISVEMHAPMSSYGMNENMYNELIDSVITNSSYVPIWVSLHYHIRAFYINVGDPYCVGKYFRSKWCGNFEYYKSSRGSRQH